MIVVDSCANCGRTIGKLEPAHLWQESVVCGECLGRLRASQSSEQINYQSPAPPVAPMVIQVTSPPNPGLAALINVFLPGFGHMYLGRTGEGVFWLISVVAGYFFFVCPGVALHIASIISAALHNPNRGPSRFRWF